MLNEFLSVDYIFTFAGLVVVLGLIVQFTKSMIKLNFSDQAVRAYAFIWALILVVIMFWYQGRFDVTGREAAVAFLLVLFYSMSITVASMGGYEVITDFKAEKTKTGV